MSDPDAAPDPIDGAYVQAEALLGDDEARAARRARVLAAVAHESESPPAPPAPARRPVWARGRWLAAASVAGLGVLIATQIYTPPHQAATEPSAPGPTPASPIAAPRGIAVAPPPPAAVVSVAPPPRAVAAGPRPAAPINLQTIAPLAPSAPPADVAPEPQAFPAPPPPPPSPQAVTAERRANDQAVADQSAVPRARVPVTVSAFTGQSREVQPTRPEAGTPPDQAARLRAAAAAGRTAAVEALLAQGVSADAPDAEGNTALMDAVQAGHPAAAASLRRHGASLDRRNRAGESARDMAAAKGDAALNQALGLAP